MNSLEQFSQLPYSHHAFGIESSDNLTEELLSIIPREECSYIFDRVYDSFKIDDARVIKSLQAEKTEKAALFIITFTLMNKEAQNAMLKVLEEPTSNTYFILIFPSSKRLLPTLQSRLALVSYKKSNKEQNLRINLQDFLSMDLQKRFDIIKALTDKKSDNPISKSEILVFLNELEVHLHNKKDIKPATLETVFEARRYLGANGSSHKMILDMIAMQV